MRIALTLAVTLLTAGLAHAADPALKTDDEKTFYALGFSQGQRMSVFVLSKAELEIVKRGLADGVNGATSAVDMNVYGPKINDMVRTRAPLKQKADAAAAVAVKAKMQAYQDKAAKEPGAQKLPSGLIYKDLTVGAGLSPKATDTVKVHYKGTFTDGAEFDSSYKRNEPTEFPLNGVIKCWTEGVAKMKVGGKAKLVCPSDIAYGDSGRPGIPGGSTLVFEVELLEIKGVPATGTTPAK